MIEFRFKKISTDGKEFKLLKEEVDKNKYPALYLNPIKHQHK